MPLTPTPVHSNLAQAASRSTPHTHWPDKPAPAFIYRKESQGPPRGAGPWRYDEQDGWYNPTYPCTGPKPTEAGERAICDVHTKQWYVDSDRGAGSWTGSLVNMGPCAIDRLHPPPVGTHGKPTCDRLTGRYYYSSVDGYPETQAFPNGRRSVYDPAERKAMINSRDGRKLSSKVASVEADRGYRKPAVNFKDPYTGRLPPALTGMGGDRARGHYQQNSQIRPSMKILARPVAKPHWRGQAASVHEPAFGRGARMGRL